MQSRSPERNPLFPSPINYSSSQISFSLSKFEKYFGAIRKNDKNCQETLRRDNFKKPRKEASTSEQVGPISISNFEEE